MVRQSEVAIRSSALVCGVALIPVIYLLGKQFFHKSIGLLAAALVAVNLFHIQYSQEARAYSLVVLLVSLSSLFLARYLGRPSFGSWIGYVLATTLAMYAHIFAVLVIGTQVAWLFSSAASGTMERTIRSRLGRWASGLCRWRSRPSKDACPVCDP